MLPTGAGAIATFLAVSAYGRVPAMLNFTSGAAAIKSALKTAQVKKIATARRLIDMAGLQPLVDELSQMAEIVYLEDIRSNLSLLDKIAAAVGQYLPGLVTSRVSPDAPAVILFTSGTEGEPKGVALSHRNLLANVEQVRVHLELYPSDILLNPLPAFHCFGLTVGSLMPPLLGLKVVCHPTPLQPQGDRQPHPQAPGDDPGVHRHLHHPVRARRRARRSQIAAAHRLRRRAAARRDPRAAAQETRHRAARRLWRDRNLSRHRREPSRRNRPGTVGQLMADMQMRLEPVEGIPNAGRLVVKGPNVMLGYLKADAPGKIVPPEGGWHDTGDVVSVDDEGFIAIKGRLKRFAKIGGESVSLAVVESCASALWPDFSHAAITVPDGRKGEQIVLVTTNPDANRHDIVGWAHNHGVSELAIPRRLVHVGEIPVLGTGKTDYVKVQTMLPPDAPAA